MKMPPLDMVDSMKSIVITVEVKRGTELIWRIRLGRWLIGMAARVLNCSIEVNGLEL